MPEVLVAEGRFGVRVGQTTAEAEAELREVVAGACARDEWLRGHPVDVRITGGDVRLQFQTILGKAYRLERADDPAGPWFDVVNFVIGTGNAVEVIDGGAATEPKRFYRINLVP